MSKRDLEDLNMKNLSNLQNRIFSVSKLNLIKKIYKKINKKNNKNSDDFIYEENVRERYKPTNNYDKMSKNENLLSKEENFINGKKMKEMKQKFTDKENFSSKENSSLIVKEKIDNFNKYFEDPSLKNIKFLITKKINSKNKILNSNQISSNEQLKKNEFHFFDNKIDIDNSFDARLYDENKVKRLEEWDKQRLKINQNHKNILLNKDLESLNSMNEIRDSLSKIDKKNMTSLLNDFYKKSAIEQGTILMSNINLGKKTFNFEIFENKKIINKDYLSIQYLNSLIPYDDNFINSNRNGNVNEAEDNSLLTFNNNNYIKNSNENDLNFKKKFNNFQQQLSKASRPRTQNIIESRPKTTPRENLLSSKKKNKIFIDAFSNINKNNLDDFINNINKKKEEDFFKSNDIKIEGELESLTNIDLYRKIVKEKKELENTYRKELIKVAHQTQNKKLQKEKINKECIFFANNLQKIRSEFRVKK